MGLILCKQDYVEQRFKEKFRGLPRPIVRIPACGDVERPGAPLAAVVPIRQFCEVKKPDAEKCTASFIRAVKDSPAPPTDDGLVEPITLSSVKGTAKTRSLPRPTVAHIPPPRHGDLSEKIRDAYLRGALDDEAAMLLCCVYDDDRPGGPGGGSKRNFWVNGNTGRDVSDDSTMCGDAVDCLTCKGLFDAKNKILGHFNASLTVCYTTTTALADLKLDPDFERNGGYPLEAGAVAGDMALIRGILLVATPRLAAPTCGAHDAGARSVMFVPHKSFGLISDDKVIVTKERDGAGGCRLAARHLVGGVVICTNSTCRISHA